MSTSTNATDVLRFEIAVNGAAYRSLVAGLREPGQNAHSSRPFKSSVKAAIDLDLSSRSYSVSQVGRHRLPKPLSIKPGSRTHDNISGVLASSLRGCADRDISNLIYEIIAAAPEISGEMLKVFRNDIEFNEATIRPNSTRTVRKVSGLSTIAPTVLLDVDDGPTLIVPERPESLIDAAVEALNGKTRIISAPQAQIAANTVTITTVVGIPQTFGVEVDLFMHWGSYEELAPAWQDEHISSSVSNIPSRVSVEHRIHVPRHGHYGATFFVRARGSNESIWLGNISSDDLRFHIYSDDSQVITERDTMLREMREISTEMLSLSVSNPHTLAEQVETISGHAPHIGLGATLREVAQRQPDSEHLSRIAEVVQQSAPSSNLESMFLNYGVGEIVFATPEGPHAAAGGLAQVISGLPPELCKAGIPVTVISPLYTYDNGNKHPAARHILEHGVQLGSEKVKPTYVGAITVNLGPTYHVGTTFHRRAPSSLPMKVYLAQSGSLRLFLLSNSSVFDRLYQPVYADEQLRRAIVLSRATLEAIATSHFGIRPSAIISNDWMTACIPAFAALDSSYQQCDWLKSCKTIHMIHNGGADYHGRLPVTMNHEDLWPMLNLGAEHYFGFRDPHNSNLINFTMAAAQHVSGALLTVSQPYARQISTLGGGDGIDYVLQHKRGSVYGISNGISRDQIDRYLSTITGRDANDLVELPTLLTAKATTKRKLQEQFRLQQRDDARIISFVGRMAEQKGLLLLSGTVEHGHHSALEDMLIRHQDVQLIIAGPTTNGDRASDEFRNEVLYLAWKYAGRVAAHFDYIAHSKALEIIFGSTFFLMPSRFEPGGITQLEALATGTLVIGRNVGGISATIDNFDQEANSGNGFLFNDFTPTAFANTAHWAITAAREQTTYEMLVSNARNARHTWSDRVPAYRAMLQHVMLGHETFSSLTWNNESKLKIPEMSAL